MKGRALGSNVLKSAFQTVAIGGIAAAAAFELARLLNGGMASVPGDMATTSASGLDPDISPQSAEAQVDRVAKARNLPPDQVRGLIEAHTSGRLLGLFGAPRVNVLQLNLALDAVGHG